MTIMALIKLNTIVFAIFLCSNCLGESKKLTTEQIQDRDEFIYGTFPSDFKWGFASASYQVEGGYNSYGKGQNIWDEYTSRVPSPIKDGSDGKIACDSFNKYKEDVQLIKNTGANYYRFSISWSRILPKGTNEEINFIGIDYYNNLINELIRNGIEPMVTLYHWDLPQPLQDIGGWLNEENIAHFKNYANIAYQYFGDRVKLWITFNEPWVFCVLGYNEQGLAPGIGNQTHGAYRCGHTVLKAHAEAYHLYNDTYREIQKGKCGITLDASWYEPEDSENPEHQAAAFRAIIFKQGWLGYPVFFGKYPDIMRNWIDQKSKDEGWAVSKLPEFDEYWSKKLKGSTDYLGLNHYTAEMVRPVNPSNINNGSYWNDQNIEWFRDAEWEHAASDWLYIVPWGFRKLLNWLKDTYDNPEILVTENGYSDYGTDEPIWNGSNFIFNDTGRISYYRRYINEMLKAVVIDGVNIKSYTSWSIVDNFEWSNGYTERFGVHWVNFTDPQRTRIPKESVGALTKIFTDNGFPVPN